MAKPSIAQQLSTSCPTKVGASSCGRSRLKMLLDLAAAIDQKLGTWYHLTYHWLSDREGDCDPPAVTCQCSYWKSPSIWCRWWDWEGQVAVFPLMWRSLPSFPLCRALAKMWENGGDSAGDYRQTWIMVLSLGEEVDCIISFLLHSTFHSIDSSFDLVDFHGKRSHFMSFAFHSGCEISNVSREALIRYRFPIIKISLYQKVTLV